jgi:DNA mismatch endonuclease (patch repair protein)
MRKTASYVGLAPSSEKASRSARGASKKKGTTPELLLRQALTTLGLRYRLTPSGQLVGKPDVIFPRARVAVFVDGDFWHGRDLERRIRRLACGHNAPYWVEKIKGNVARDRRVDEQLAQAGWVVQRFWEADIRKNAADAASQVASVVSKRLANMQ